MVKAKSLKLQLQLMVVEYRRKVTYFDWRHEGKVLDITVEEEDYQIIRNYLNNIWIVDNVEELEEQSNRVDKILRNSLDIFGIPETYNVCAFFKESIGKV